MKFAKNHIHQHPISKSRASGKSSASSFEAIYNQNKFLGDDISPAVTILIRAVRADREVQGYQIAAYLDKATSRVQIIMDNLVQDDQARICVDGVLLSNHKVVAKIAWGIDCKQYETEITAETGFVSQNPGLRVKLTWEKLPSSLRKHAKRVSEYLPRAALMAGMSQAKAKNMHKQIKLTLAIASERSLYLILKTPRMTMYRLAMRLPFALPIGATAAEMSTLHDNVADQIYYMFSKVNSAECHMDKDTLTTFNNRKYKSEMPLSCYQVLAQDCTKEHKFMVLLQKNPTNEQNDMNVKIANVDIDLYHKDNKVLVKVNGQDIVNLPYNHPSGSIQIRQTGAGLSLHAPSHGLHEIYYDVDMWKVQIVDWMKGQTCGLCGRADGELRQEYRSPSGRLTKSPVSFAHSWVLPAESCRDNSECRMKLESVKLDKQKIVNGQESKCYSVEPVLRCLDGCYPVRTTPVTIGFHCVPTNSNLNRADGLMNIYEKSVDLRETTEAHVACRCTTHCA